MFIATKEGGQAFAFPDVCKTPPFAIPIPYPNFAFLSNLVGSTKVFIQDQPIGRKGDKIVTSTGDEPGVMMGVISGTVKGPAELKVGWSSVKIEGKNPSYLGAMTKHNNGNHPAGAVVAPGQTVVKVGGGGGSGAGAPPPPPAPSSPDPGRAGLAERKRQAVEWAEKVSDSVPLEKKDRAKTEEERRKYEARRAEIREAARKILDGERRHASGATCDELQRAADGDVPLTFPTPEIFRQFQEEVRAAFAAEGIHDATVQQVGSSTTGFRGNPNKRFAGWTIDSDADFAVFSAHALVQAMEKGVPPNPKTIMNGRYSVLKNEAQPAGFHDTPIGKRLKTLAAAWSRKLFRFSKGDEIDFKLNLTTEPFPHALTVIRP